jgi:hypothetical protein
VGGGGLSKNPQRASEYTKKGEQLGFGPGAVAAGETTGRGRNADRVLVEEAQLARYEDANMMRAVYFGDSSRLPGETQYVQGYLLAQVNMLAAECESFKLTEVRQMEGAAARSVMPNNEREMMQMGWQALANSLQLAANATRNPQSLVDAGMRQTRIEDAPTYGQKDLVLFVTQHGGCGKPPLDRYTRNLRQYFSARR